jgi:hypothetical protein
MARTRWSSKNAALKADRLILGELVDLDRSIAHW